MEDLENNYLVEIHAAGKEGSPWCVFRESDSKSQGEGGGRKPAREGLGGWGEEGAYSGGDGDCSKERVSIRLWSKKNKKLRRT